MGSARPRWTLATDYWGQTSKKRVARLAARQFGRITRAQLDRLGIAESTIDYWLKSGYLIPALPGVYAVGHHAPDERARLFELALFAGPGAAVSHGTAANWRGWLRYPVATTHISTPRRIRARLPGVVFHSRRELEREFVNGVPCTTVTQTLLDLAATESRKLVLHALAQLDFERRLDAVALRTVCALGRRGSAALRLALDAYIPQLARTKSDLEDEFLLVCSRGGFPLPQVNVEVHGFEVDCYWPELGLVVELDGGANHGTPAQRNRDQRRALKLRAQGLAVVRYGWDQVSRNPETVLADLHRQPARRAA